MAKPTKAAEKTGAENESGDFNKSYEEWPVKVMYKDGEPEFKKNAMEANRVTRISPDKADELNSQSHNTLVRLYEI